MLKISKTQSAHRGMTLHLEGRVVGPWVGELQQSCESILCEGRSLCLRLADVDFLDSEGVMLLRRLRTRGVSLRDSPPFITELLRGLD